MTSTSIPVQVGHVATTGFAAPPELWMMTVKDNNTGMLNRDYADTNRYIMTYFPHPIRFRKVWSMQQTTMAGSNAVYLWEPIPPNGDFAAIGLVATNHEEEPEPSIVHCVPSEWCRKVDKGGMQQLWNNAGLGGSKAAVWTPEGQTAASLFTARVGPDASLPPEFQKMDYITFYGNL